MREKLTAAVKEVELRRRELQSLKSRLEARRKSLFEITIRASEEKDEIKARVYANEHAELVKSLRVVTKAELALTQTAVRIESIRDIGDVFHQVTSAFRIVRKVSRTFSELLPSIEDVSEEVSSTLSQTMVELGNISPELSINVETDSADDILRRAREYAQRREEQVRDLAESFLTYNRQGGGRIALLANQDGGAEKEDHDDEAFKAVIFAKAGHKSVDEAVHRYLEENGNDLDVLKASNSLRLPVDEVEQSVLRLASQERINLSGRIRRG